MEFLGGITLADRIRSLPPLSVLEVIQIVEQIARGLREAHRQGVVHRDLKPANVMLVPEDEGVGKIKILDFGLVKLIESEQSIEITGAGEMLGSPKYMSPEQVTGAVKIDQYTDIYSLGVMLYEMLSGRAPFDGDTAMQVVVAVLNHNPAPIGDISREPLPFELISLVTRCMSRTPQSRPASMDQVLSELRACKVALGVDPGATDSPSYSGRSASRPQLQPSSISGSIAGMETIPLSNLGLQNSARNKQPDLTHEPARPARRGLWVGAAVATLAVIVGGRAVVVSNRSDTSSVTSGVPTPSTTASDRFSFRIASTPPGAEVWQETALLGITPLELSLDNTELSKTPRSFVLKLSGYSPLVVQRGPSPEAVSLQVNLLPISTTDASSASLPVASAGAAKTTRPTQTASPAKTTPTAQPTSDIHLTR
jgi:serine/threonine-protein kinase